MILVDSVAFFAFDGQLSIMWPIVPPLAFPIAHCTVHLIGGFTIVQAEQSTLLTRGTLS